MANYFNYSSTLFSSISGNSTSTYTLGDYNMIVSYTTKELDLLARIMRAEAQTEGDLGMLMVGNVGVNRVLANCLTFKNIRTVYNMIYQKH